MPSDTTIGTLGYGPSTGQSNRIAQANLSRPDAVRPGSRRINPETFFGMVERSQLSDNDMKKFEGLFIDVNKPFLEFMDGTTMEQIEHLNLPKAKEDVLRKALRFKTQPETRRWVFQHFVDHDSAFASQLVAFAINQSTNAINMIQALPLPEATNILQILTNQKRKNSTAHDRAY